MCPPQVLTGYSTFVSDPHFLTNDLLDEQAAEQVNKYNYQWICCRLESSSDSCIRGLQLLCTSEPHFLVSVLNPSSYRTLEATTVEALASKEDVNNSKPSGGVKCDASPELYDMP